MFQSELTHSGAGDVADATDLIAAYVADGYEIHLFTEGLVPNKDTDAAGFAAFEADFTGYAAKPIGGAGFLFVGPMEDSDGNIVFSTPSVTWIATDAVNPNLIAGCWVETTAGAVRRYCVFPESVPMNEALKFLDLTIFEEPGLQGYVMVEN